MIRIMDLENTPTDIHTHAHSHNEIAFNFVPAWNAVEGKEIFQRLVIL